MRITEDIKPVTYVKTRAAELLSRLAENRRPVVITQNGEPRGVLLDVESYQELKDATLLLKLVAQGEADGRADRVKSHEEVISGLRARLESE
jgi:prevent-host-death family protein